MGTSWWTCTSVLSLLKKERLLIFFNKEASEDGQRGKGTRPSPLVSLAVLFV
jgi:hypothetical protein